MSSHDEHDTSGTGRDDTGTGRDDIGRSSMQRSGVERNSVESGGVSALDVLGQSLLRDAREHSSQRAARTIVATPSMRATVIALLAGSELAEHASPPTATLQAVTGEVSLRAGDGEQTVRAGEIARIPPERHSLHATTDAVVLLTVALH